MKQSETAAVVVWYNPEKSFALNINTYLGDVDHLYIIDNSEIPDTAIHNGIKENSRITLISDHVNHGVAKALNIGATKATAAGYRWLLTMDQDSAFDENVLKNYLRAAASFAEIDNVAVFGLPYSSSFLNQIPADQLYIPVDSMISSGCLVNLKAYSRIGPFNEMLFIDEVDHEYCYRSKLMGYLVICIKAGLLFHSLGQQLQVTGPLNGRRKQTTVHSPLRLYYIVRNGLYIAKKFQDSFPEQAAKRRKILYVTIKNNLLYGQNRITALKYILLGYRHYRKNRYYKL